MKWLEGLLVSRVKEAVSTDWQLGSLAINGEVRENVLVLNMDAGSKRAFSKIKESGAYFNANEREVKYTREKGSCLAQVFKKEKNLYHKRKNYS